MICIMRLVRMDGIKIFKKKVVTLDLAYQITLNYKPSRMISNVLRNSTRIAQRSVATAARPAIQPRSLVGPSSARFYHERVMDHYSNPRNVS